MNDDDRICTACRFGVCSQHQPSPPGGRSPRSSDELPLTEAFTADAPRVPRMTHKERDAKLRDIEQRLERLAEQITPKTETKTKESPF